MVVSGVLVSILAVLLVLGVLTYFLWYKDKRVGTVFLYEKIGMYERFSGVFPLYIIRAQSTDVYKIGGTCNKTIDKPAPEDFFDTTGHYKKVVHITKFSEDDFRIKKRLDDTWYKNVEVEVEEPTGEMIFDEETGMEVPEMQIKKNVIKESYHEPLGITQEGRDAIRIGLENERMLKEELKDNTFWDKWGQPLMVVSVIMILGLTMMSVSKDNTAAIQATAEVCNDNYEVISKEVKSPAFAKNILEKVKQDEINNNAPPK